MSSLIDRILQGDEQAVTQWYQTYAPLILRYLKRKLPYHTAHEILNDVFLDAIDELPSLHDKTQVKAWLYKIAHNKMVNFYRKKRIQSFLFSQMPYLEILASEINEPEFQLEKNRMRDNIEVALHSLSQRYQQILHMRYERNMQVKNIALNLNLSFKATESLLYRARKDFIKAYGRT